ncbi:acetolactate decarboxylase [Ruegeria meonggei]|uniref:Alpha-acetolactate decarboxylase n=1 Tax=Ruegeria meonggei TaxID=1446476 RepID=A0A1X6ZN97_9RHOB|nr:acetolactate decarboxylase [Ruegeria meonggei]SLN54517.1 Alpha-acetolactate decarboxylase [Ruegeria meonggei]
MRQDKELTFATALASHSREQGFQSEKHAHEYYQASLLSAVVQGVYDGTVSIEQLLEHGNFGLGTFNALDGEMIVLDGVAYRLDGDGNASVASNNALTPYAGVINFEPAVIRSLDTETQKDALEAQLDALAEARNLFYAVRFIGNIKHIKYRNVLRQEKPYKPLLEVVKTQAEFELNNVEGTILGFRCPDYAVGIGVPGYHLQFISADLSKGGHVLDYTLNSGRIEIDHTSSLHLELPETRSFSDANLSAGTSADSILKAESNDT